MIKLAQQHVRSRTRSPVYLEHGDRFAVALLGSPFGVPPERSCFVATDLASIIDTCYEQSASLGEKAALVLLRTTRDLQDMTDPSIAVLALPALHAQLGASSCPLLDVARAILAAMTLLGQTSMSQRASPGAAAEWLALWRERVWRHNHQQQIHTGLSVLAHLPAEAARRFATTLEIPARLLHPSSITFSAGVRDYLAAFADTGAAAMATVGGLPFAERFSSEDLAQLITFLRATPELLDLVNSLLRLAQDIAFDASEVVNIRLAGMSSERRGMGAEVRGADGCWTVEAEDDKLQREWLAFLAEYQERVAPIVAGASGGEALRRSLSEFVGAVALIAQALTRAPHKS